jgi:hypothetical protein
MLTFLHVEKSPALTRAITTRGTATRSHSSKHRPFNARQTLIAAQLQLAQAEDALAREIDAEAAERELALATANLTRHNSSGMSC